MTILRATGSLVFSLVTVWGQARPASEPVAAPIISTPVASAPSSTSLPEHKVVPNDLLSVVVFDEPSLSRPAVRVSADGTIALPELKSPIRVEGLLPREIEAEVQRQEIEQGILVHPLVTASILEYASRVVSVVGYVRNPGLYPITGPMNLFDALAKAGWTLPDAGPDLFFSKTAAEPARRISVDQLLHGADASVNVPLTGGEVISVPEAPKVWVTGNITHPQAVIIRRLNDASVLKIVASVEGLTQYYAKTAYIYRPDAVTGKRQEIPVPLFAIMHRKANDVGLLPDDILLIPDDNGTKRRAILQELATLSGVGASSAIVLGMR